MNTKYPNVTVHSPTTTATRLPSWAHCRKAARRAKVSSEEIELFTKECTSGDDYLGHASVATTGRYITTNLQMKRDAMQAFWKTPGIEPAMEAEGQPPGVLAVLVSDSYAEHAAAPVRMCVAASVHYSR